MICWIKAIADVPKINPITKITQDTAIPMIKLATKLSPHTAKARERKLLDMIFKLGRPGAGRLAAAGAGA